MSLGGFCLVPQHLVPLSLAPRLPVQMGIRHLRMKKKIMTRPRHWHQPGEQRVFPLAEHLLIICIDLGARQP